MPRIVCSLKNEQYCPLCFIYAGTPFGELYMFIWMSMYAFVCLQSAFFFWARTASGVVWSEKRWAVVFAGNMPPNRLDYKNRTADLLQKWFGGGAYLESH